MTEVGFCLEGKKASSYRGAYVQGSMVSLVCLSVCLCMCNLRGFYSLRGRYEEDFHKPRINGSGRACVNTWECFVACRREVIAVASCCGFRGVFWVRRDFVFILSLFSFEHTRPAANMRLPCLIYLSTSD